MMKSIVWVMMLVVLVLYIFAVLANAGSALLGARPETRFRQIRSFVDGVEVAVFFF